MTIKEVNATIWELYTLTTLDNTCTFGNNIF